MTTVRRLAWLQVLPAAAANADIHKCPGRNGLTVYQNFPCDVDSMGSLPASGSARGKVAPSSSAALRKTTESTQPVAVPRVGMTTTEIKTIWGEPREVTKEEFAKGDVQIWSYSDSRSIRFDHKGFVTAFQW
jgi:hypothetical protein